MAGETLKTTAVCLRIVPWSRTSHVVSWLTPDGKVVTVVKGAVRPKSAFLGQYDLNYTCEILYYARAKGEMHALRECAPLRLREELRDDYRKLALGDYFRTVGEELAPTGEDCKAWYEIMESALDHLAALGKNASFTELLKELVDFEMKSLSLSGLDPQIEAEAGAFRLKGERSIPIDASVAEAIKHIREEKSPQIILDATRVIGVFYQFHLDCASELRRNAIRLISNSNQGEMQNEH